MRRVLVTVFGGTMPLDTDKNTQNMQTWTRLLDYFDEIHIVCCSSDKKDHTIKHKAKEIYIHHICAPENRVLRYIISIVRMIKKVVDIDKKYHISVLDASEPLMGGVVCSLSKFIIRKPYLLEIQGELVNISPKTVGYLKAKLFRIITILVEKNADRIRAVSNTIKSQLIAAGIKEYKITVVTSRVKLENFNIIKYQDAKAELRKNLGIDAETKLFVFVGRLVVYKGLRYLFDAVKNMQGMNFKLLIIGDGELRDELQSQVKELNIEEKVIFHGAVSYDNVPYFIAAADLLIMPSLDEGFPRVMLEAMSLKIPVIASRVGGIREVIEDGINGYFCEPSDPDSIVSTVKKFCRENKKEIIVDNAYNKVYENFEFETSMAKFIDLYRQLIEN